MMPARDRAKVQGLKGTLGLVLPVMYFQSLITSSSIFCRVLQGQRLSSPPAQVS